MPEGLPTEGLRAEGLPAEALQPFGTAVLTGDPKIAARALLGALLVHETQQGVIAVRLLETEAYGGPEGQDGLVDPASHAYRRRTPRNDPMFGLPGTLYVYFTYGMHWCVNVVCGRDGVAGAVLLRAGVVVCGAELATANRRGAPFRDLARGPARLSQAAGVQGWANGHDLRFPPLRLAVGWPIPEEAVTWTARIGLSLAADQPWRALEAKSRYVSRPRAGAIPPGAP